jgi:uncharacterized Zn-finger protein
MQWKIFSLDNRKINYDNLGENQIPITEIDKMPDISDNLKIDNKIYSVSIISYKDNCVGVHEINYIDNEDVEETDELEFTCPYCGYEYLDAFELEDEGEINCPRCDSELKFVKDVVVTYRVEPIKRKDIIKIN